jgi:Tfp pilus assembly protein PilW
MQMSSRIFRKKLSSGKGFSLAELLVGVAILVTVLTGSLATFIYCMLLNESSRNLAVATNDAQYVLEQIRALDYGSIAGYSAPTFNNLRNETITLTRSVGSSLASVTVTVSWQERASSRSHSMTSYFAN